MALRYTFTARLWLYPGEAGWHFLTVPDGVSAEIREETAAFRHGFGSIKITAIIAGHRWSTSLFPDSHQRFLSASGQEGHPDRRRHRSGGPGQGPA